MKPNRKEIIVIGTIGDQQKEIILSEQSTTIYNISIDKEYQGQVLQLTGKWGVYLIPESWLNGEEYDEMRQEIRRAVLNAENQSR